MLENGAVCGRVALLVFYTKLDGLTYLVMRMAGDGCGVPRAGTGPFCAVSGLSAWLLWVGPA